MAGNKNKKKSKSSWLSGLNPLKWFSNLLAGRVFVTLDFFRRHWVAVLGVTIMLLMYISAKYTHQANIKKNMDLKVELANAETDLVNSSARYNSMIRESSMEAYLDSLHMNLKAPTQPPYYVEK